MAWSRENRSEPRLDVSEHPKRNRDEASRDGSAARAIELIHSRAFILGAVISIDRVATLDVAAASGLVLRGGELIVIADDELALSRYDRAGAPRGRVPLFAGSLPAERQARKRSKPDLEALAELPDGRLIAFGSGSAPARDRAALVSADLTHVIELNLAPLYEALRRAFDRLNVEGACAVGGALVLLTRRTGRKGRNALVRLDLADLLAALDRGSRRFEPDLLVDVREIDLGMVAGTALGFTDAAAWREGILFSAAAEVTDDPVDDGACVGCEIGWIDPGGQLRHREPIAPCVKLEGIAVDESSGERRLFAVSDADDPATPALFFSAPLPAAFP